MPETVYRKMTLLCVPVASRSVGTNVGLVHLLWMLVERMAAGDARDGHGRLQRFLRKS